MVTGPRDLGWVSLTQKKLQNRFSIYDFGDFKFFGLHNRWKYHNRLCRTLFVTFCDMSQKAIDTTGYGPRPCGVDATKKSSYRDLRNYLACKFNQRDTLVKTGPCLLYKIILLF